MSEAALPVWWERFIVIEKKKDKNLKLEPEHCFNIEQKKWEELDQENDERLSRIVMKIHMWWQQPRTKLTSKDFQKQLLKTAKSLAFVYRGTRIYIFIYMYEYAPIF